MNDLPRKNATKTRGRPFAPGNSGRPRGARHKTTMLAEKLMQKDAEGVVNSVIKAAKNGDMTAARIILERIAPARKDNPAPLELPEIQTAHDASQAMSAILSAVADGSISPSEGVAVSGLVETYIRTLELTDFERRLALLEQAKGKQ